MIKRKLEEMRLSNEKALAGNLSGGNKRKL